MASYPFHLRRPKYGEPIYSRPAYYAPTLGSATTWEPGGGFNPTPGGEDSPVGARQGSDRASTGRMRGVRPLYPNS